MTLLLNQHALARDPRILGLCLDHIAADAEFLRSTYPNFDQWLSSKVLPGIYTGERTLLIEERGSMVVGLLILKHSATEKKLCTLRVRPHFESKGLGVRLFQTAFELLGTERPLLSVSEPLQPRFQRLFTYFGFAKEAVYRGKYLPMVNELAYNGLLDAQMGSAPKAVRATAHHPSSADNDVARHESSCRGVVCVSPA